MCFIACLHFRDGSFGFGDTKISDISIGTISAAINLDLSDLKQGVTDAIGSFNKIDQSVKVSVGSITQNVKVMAAAVQTDAEKMARALAAIEASRARAMQGLSQLSNVFLGVGTAIGAELGLATKAAADFDSGLHEVAANAGLTGDQYKKMHDGILAIAKDANVRDTPAQLAKGLYNVISAGFTGQKALDVLHESALGAAAGLTDTKTASNALTAVLNSGIKGVDNERQAMDLLLKAVEQGKMKFPELANNLGKIAPTAAAVGVSLQELLAGIVLFTRQGQPVARATTDLTNVITHIARPSQQARQEFKELGIEYGVNALKVKGLTGVLDDIILRTKGHTDTLIKLFPELRSYRGAVEAAQNSGKGFHEILGMLSHATDGQGQTMRAATIVNQGAEQQYAKMRQEITTLQTEMGEKLLPTMRQAIGQVRDMVTWFSNLSEGTKSNYLRVAEWIGGIAITFGTIGKFLVFLNSIRTAYLGIAGAAGIASAAQGGAATAGAAGAAGLLGRLGGLAAGGVGLLARVANPVTLTVAGLVASQQAGAGVVGDAAPRGKDDAAELARVRSRLLFVERQIPNAAGEYLQQLQSQKVSFTQQIKTLEESIKAQQATTAAAKSMEDAKLAAAKVDMEYAKAGLAADPFPGGKDKKGKGGKGSKDDKDPDMGDIIADHIKSATQTAPFKASCAFFVTEVLKQSGVAVKGSNSVKDLWQQLLAAGAEEVSGGFKRGDILKFHGKAFGTSRDAEGKGNHTGIYNGDGTFTDSHDFNTRRTTRNLADYMRANPDADIHALRLGDKDDRTSKMVENRNESIEKLSETKEKIDELKDKLFELTHAEDEVKAHGFLKEFFENAKIDPKAALALLIAQMNELADARAKVRASDDANLDTAKYEAMASDAKAMAELEKEYDAQRKAADRDDLALAVQIADVHKTDVESQMALDKELFEQRKADNEEQLGRDTWQAEVAQKDRQSQAEQDAIPSAHQKAVEHMRATLQTMRQGVESILGGAFEKLFSGDSKHFFSSLLQGFTQMLTQMAAKALALGIINLLTGGAGGFLGGGGKGNGGLLSVFGFDDANNDRKAHTFGYDFASLFKGGMSDFNSRHTGRQAGNGAGTGDTHVHITMPGMVVREHADIDRLGDALAWKMQSGLSGRFVGSGG